MSAFTLRELDGQRRTLVLTGDAGPIGREIALGGTENRGEVERYHGSDSGVWHQAGVSPMPTEFEFRHGVAELAGGGAGLLVDGAAGQPIRDPARMRELWASLLRGGLLEVDYLGLTQVGFIRSQVPHVGEGGRRVRVEVSFDWISAPGPGSQALTPPRPEDTARSLTDRWMDALDTIERPLTMARQRIDDSAAAVAKVNRAINRTRSIAGQAQEGVRSATALAGGMATALNSVIEASNELRDVHTAPATVLCQSEDAEAVIGALAFRGSLSRRLAGMRRESALERAQYRVQSDAKVKHLFTAADGEDLRFVAIRVYGVTKGHLWRALARFNRLGSSTLEGGQQIVIPHEQYLPRMQSAVS